MQRKQNGWAHSGRMPNLRRGGWMPCDGKKRSFLAIPVCATCCHALWLIHKVGARRTRSRAKQANALAFRWVAPVEDCLQTYGALHGLALVKCLLLFHGADHR